MKKEFEIPAEDFGVYVIDTTEEIKEEYVIIPGYGIAYFKKNENEEYLIDFHDME